MFSIAKVLEHYGADGVPEGTNRPLRCPFHSDRNASGSVDTYKELYNCHGCEAQGDAIALIRWHEGVDYETAVSRAEEITGERGDEVPRGAVSKRRSSLLPQWARDKHSDSSNLPAWLR